VDGGRSWIEQELGENMTMRRREATLRQGRAMIVRHEIMTLVREMNCEGSEVRGERCRVQVEYCNRGQYRHSLVLYHDEMALQEDETQGRRIALPS
jgi:hypothetical protein